MKTAIIIGASGLTGKECLYQLLESGMYDEVIAFVRRPLTVKHASLRQVICDFDKPETFRHEVKGDDIFCCLGTTIKDAGSRENFRKVDFTYPLQIAQIGRENKAARYFLISAAGASNNSSIFYSKVKGELEDAIAGLGFVAFHIFRPSMLLGNRRDFRAGEWVGKHLMRLLGFLFIGPLKAYKAIPASLVAKAMLKAAGTERTGTIVHTNREMLL